jgi:hypothetical protein|tara:strand:- start:1376 stop:1555 length:180 start_codon:yes stop_codon:yes gene_type:complete
MPVEYTLLGTAVVFMLLGHFITAKSNNVNSLISRKPKFPQPEPPADEEVDESFPDWQKD